MLLRITELKLTCFSSSKGHRRNTYIFVPLRYARHRLLVIYILSFCFLKIYWCSIIIAIPVTIICYCRAQENMAKRGSVIRKLFWRYKMYVWNKALSFNYIQFEFTLFVVRKKITIRKASIWLLHLQSGVLYMIANVFWFPFSFL